MAAPRILVTGAGGFVGPWLLRELRARLPAEGAVVGTYRDEADSPEAEGIRLDLRDGAAIERVVAAFRPTALIHLAGLSSVPLVRSDPDLAWDVNVKATGRLCAAVLRHAPAARFVFVSSGEVYGGRPAPGATLIDEDTPLAPRNLYAATKAAADLLVGQQAAEGLNAIRFRPFNHTGAGQSPDFVVPAFARQIADIEAGRREPVIAVGNLESERDFCDVRDIVAAYAAVALGEGPVPCGVVNLASGQPRSIASVLDALLAMTPLPVALRTDPALLRPSEPFAAGIATELAREALGWRPAIAWHDTLRDVLDDWRARAARATQPA